MPRRRDRVPRAGRADDLRERSKSSPTAALAVARITSGGPTSATTYLPIGIGHGARPFQRRRAPTSAFGVAPATASTNYSNRQRTLGRTGHGVPNVALRRSGARWSRRLRAPDDAITGREYRTPRQRRWRASFGGRLSSSRPPGRSRRPRLLGDRPAGPRRRRIRRSVAPLAPRWNPRVPLLAMIFWWSVPRPFSVAR